MTRVAYLDCIGGIAGDMVLAALLDAGAAADALCSVPARLAIEPVDIAVTRVHRHGIAATYVEVTPPPQPPHRTWGELRRIVEAADLPERARARALAAFAALADAEARVHGVPVEDVHFHELGGVDTLVDVCGAGLLLEELGVDDVACSALPLASGLGQVAHGALPLPAPATVELLRGAQISGADGARELVTPTGAALAMTLAGSFGPLPPLTLEGIGYGAGRDDFPDRPNLLRVLLGSGAPAAVTDVILLETNLDDVNPELVPDAVERCFEAGALDVWTTPVQMKKGRPGIVLSALARAPDERAIAAAMLEETSALGVRVQRLHRYELDRETRVVELGGDRVRVKVGRLDGRVVNLAPEHDDCARLARRTGRSVKSVWAAAIAAAHAEIS